MSAISEADRQRALSLARAAISEQVLVRRPPSPTDQLRSRISGVFVSLHLAGKLRGCIGTTAPEIFGPAVQRMAIAAAIRDPRFAPVAANELDHLDIEISVLTPPEPIAGAADITIGLHGLTVTTATQRGLLLPQVASEGQMTAEQFVDAVCIKAGIAREVLEYPATVLARFRAEVFGER